MRGRIMTSWECLTGAPDRNGEQELGRRESWIHNKTGAGGNWPIMILAAYSQACRGRVRRLTHQGIQALPMRLTTNVK